MKCTTATRLIVGLTENVRAMRAVRSYATCFQDPIEGVYGEERAELISKLRGDWNFGPSYFKRGKGTLEEMNHVPSAAEHRMIGCVCEPTQLFIHYMWLRKGFPRRCKCGYWFKLVEE